MSIAQYEQPSALATYQDAAVGRLAEWAHSADAAYAVAERLAQSAFVPVQFRGKPIELTAAILAGSEVGLSPMSAMRSFDIISGVAAPRAITLRAIVQSYGHEIVLIESTETRCRMKGRRRGTEEWQTVSWTIDRARNLGLTTKDNWRKQPGAMLVARATSELARLIASDAILGIGYSSEEIADGGSYDEQVTVETTTPSEPTGTRKMSRRTVEPEPVAEAEIVPESPYLNPQSSLGKRMFASINEAGIGEKDRLAFCSQVAGREITTSKELTDADAEAIIAEAQSLKAINEMATGSEAAEQVAADPGDFDPTADPEWGAK